MQYRVFVLCLGVALFAACNREIDETTAAVVTETSATSATETATPAVTSSTNVIKQGSKIEFLGAKVTGSHIGVFQNFDGRVDYAGNQPVGVNFTIDLASVKTDATKLDGHLKSPDFFDVAKYPTATFESKSVRAIASDPNQTHEICGTLTMHGVSKDVCFPAKVEVTPQGVKAVAEFKINRHDWGISYRGAADDLIKDEVAIRLDMLFPPQPAA